MNISIYKAYGIKEANPLSSQRKPITLDIGFFVSIYLVWGYAIPLLLKARFEGIFWKIKKALKKLKHYKVKNTVFENN
ncbi:hypothetical protein [Myroides odoratus]|uniref:hypothetical protein n=1 Tax=Myroides odoratus TaxID=256 RepID=UPI003342AA35